MQHGLKDYACKVLLGEYRKGDRMKIVAEMGLYMVDETHASGVCSV